MWEVVVDERICACSLAEYWSEVPARLSAKVGDALEWDLVLKALILYERP